MRTWTAHREPSLRNPHSSYFAFFFLCLAHRARTAFRVEPERWDETVDYLRRREQATNVYIEVVHELRLEDGRQARALAYRVDRTHKQYCGKLPREKLLETVRGGVGLSGANPDYVLATHDHLVELGIADHTLDWLAKQLRS